METCTTFKPVCLEEYSEEELVLKYKLLTTKAYPPTRATPGSIGYDLTSPRFARIPPKGGVYNLSLGIASQIPEGLYGRLAPRSGLTFFRRIDVLVAVIDRDYRGEVKVLLINHDDKLSYLVKPGDQVVQLILDRATIARLQEVDTLEETERRTRGVGSLEEQSMAKLKGSGKPEHPSVRGWRNLNEQPWCSMKIKDL